MMFVFGEVSDAISETTQLVEDIVRSQVIEIVSEPLLFSTHMTTKEELQRLHLARKQ